jgi:DNA segregation ATPase FtsK/SpoIIIE, S-DNA-T family
VSRNKTAKTTAKNKKTKKTNKAESKGSRLIFAQIGTAFVMLVMAFVWISLFNFSVESERDNFFTGTIGYDVAYRLINLFGVTAWLIPALFVFVLLIFFKTKVFRHFVVSIVTFLFLMPFFAVLSEYILFYGIENENYLGHLIFGSYFHTYFGKTGFFLIFGFWVLIYSVISFNFSYFFVFRVLRSIWFNFKEKISQFKLIEDEEESDCPDNDDDPLEKKSEDTIEELEIVEDVKEDFELRSLGGMDSDPEQENPDGKEEEKSVSELENKSEIEVKVSEKPQVKVGDKELRSFKDYKLPPLQMLMPEDKAVIVKDRKEKVQRVGVLIERKLLEHRIKVEVKGATIGPVVTMFEVELGEGVRVNQISAMEQDLGVSVGGKKVRVVDRLPGKPYIGIEVPNDDRLMIRLKTILKSDVFAQQKAQGLPIVLGQDVDGKAYVANLAKMPHLLVAGTTGSGKSVGINTFVMSLLLNLRPDEVKFLMIDPKGNEFNIYEGIPHLLLPVVVDSKKAAKSLQWAVNEMEDRFHKLAENMVRDIEEYNKKVESINRNLKSEDHFMSKMPFIVVVIDEFADLMMVAGKDVEVAVSRIAQKARAVGIHLIVATQRPTRDVVTGLIKGNLPVRIAFRVASSLDSRTILDCNGAELLLGHGDMLFIPPGSSEPVRVHGAFVGTPEIKMVVGFIKDQVPQNVSNEAGINISPEEFLEESVSSDTGSEEEKDPLYDDILDYVVKSGKCSASMLQRKFKIGYNRASRAVDQLEEEGVISPADGSKPRQVLVSGEE